MPNSPAIGESNLRQPLAVMLSHAAQHSLYYREQGWAQRMRAGDRIRFGEIPITAKALVRDRTAEFFATFIPPGDGAVIVKHTSGSTSQPMEVRKTARHFQINTAENHRLQDGWDYGSHKKTVHITMPMADHPAGQIEETGTAGGGRRWKLYSAESRAGFELLRRVCPSMVRASPSTISAVLEYGGDDLAVLPIALIATIGEVVSEELRDLVRRIPGCRLVDNYGTVETGLIAVQCPRCDAYHPADRHLVLELIADDGRPSQPGEMGRIIATTLFNRAMPLIRYETGDYATLASSNHCPRSPRAIARIVGRESNLFKLPDGRRVIPRLPHSVAHELALRQFKLIQRTLTDIELLYIPRDDGAVIADDTAQGMIDRYMAPGFRVRCMRVSELPRAPSGKYLLHECLI